jgi:hypothetical protein
LVTSTSALERTRRRTAAVVAVALEKKEQREEEGEEEEEEEEEEDAAARRAAVLLSLRTRLGSSCVRRIATRCQIDRLMPSLAARRLLRCLPLS